MSLVKQRRSTQSGVKINGSVFWKWQCFPTPTHWRRWPGCCMTFEDLTRFPPSRFSLHQFQRCRDQPGMCNFFFSFFLFPPFYLMLRRRCRRFVTPQPKHASTHRRLLKKLFFVLRHRCELSVDAQQSNLYMQSSTERRIWQCHLLFTSWRKADQTRFFSVKTPPMFSKVYSICYRTLFKVYKYFLEREAANPKWPI